VCRLQSSLVDAAMVPYLAIKEVYVAFYGFATVMAETLIYWDFSVELANAQEVASVTVIF